MKHPKKITSMAAMMAAIIAIFTSGKEVFGQLDPTFHPPFFAVPAAPSRAQLLPDGSYLLFFNIDTLTDQPTGSIIRFLPDGTLDTSFNFSRSYLAGTTVPTSYGKLITSAAHSGRGLFHSICWPESARHCPAFGQRHTRCEFCACVDPRKSDWRRCLGPARYSVQWEDSDRRRFYSS